MNIDKKFYKIFSDKIFEVCKIKFLKMFEYILGRQGKVKEKKLILIN